MVDVPSNALTLCQALSAAAMQDTSWDKMELHATVSLNKLSVGSNGKVESFAWHCTST